jgi:hypothetical protein
MILSARFIATEVTKLNSQQYKWLPDEEPGDPSHAKVINAVFTPSAAEVKKARRIVAAFEKARAAGKERAKVDSALIEVPIYAAAKRLLNLR